MNVKLLSNIKEFTRNRLIEFSGILLILTSIFLFISILSYSPSDPNFIYTPENIEIKNMGGYYGSIISDFILQSIGLIAILLTINFLYWGFKLILIKKVNNIFQRIFFVIIYIIFGTLFINIAYNESFWLIVNIAFEYFSIRL